MYQIFLPLSILLYRSFKKYPIEGVKALDFFNFCQIATIMIVKGHLTKSGLEEIRYLKEKNEYQKRGIISLSTRVYLVNSSGIFIRLISQLATNRLKYFSVGLKNTYLVEFS